MKFPHKDYDGRVKYVGHLLQEMTEAYVRKEFKKLNYLADQVARQVIITRALEGEDVTRILTACKEATLSDY